MTKYSEELKMKVVKEYLNGESSLNGLAKKFNIGHGSYIDNR